MERNVNKNIPVIFQNLEQYEKADERFIKVKIWLMHTGENLNGSSFSKEAVELAIPSLANTPILSFIEENSSGEDDFSDHRMVLHRNDDGELSIKYLGQAIGVIPENNNAHWEKRVTDYGEEKEYLVVEGLMWTKWDDPIDIMNRKKVTAQSMELADDYTGFFDSNGIFHFETFKFFGACLLGDDVLPAMENSTVELHFSNNNMQNTIENKLQEFYTLFSNKGGTSVEDVKHEFEEQVDTTESEEIDNTEEQVEEVFEQNTTQETTEEVETEDVKEIDEQEVEVETVEVQTEETFTKEFVENLQSEINNLKEEVKNLQSYKRQREESDLSAKFEDKLSKEELELAFSENIDKSLEEIEVYLFALVGKKNFSINKENRKNTNKILLDSNKFESHSNKPYNGFFDKYLNQ